MLTPEALEQHRITHILLDYDVDPTPWTDAGQELLTRIPIAGYQSTEDVAERIHAAPGTVILDFADGGIAYEDLAEGSPLSIGELQRILGDRPAYLHLDVPAEEAEAAAAVFNGLALRGSSEEKVGYKSFDDLDDLLEALEG